MIDKRQREAISRRKALSLLGLAGALGLAVPATALAGYKPIPGEEKATQQRIPRRKRVDERRQHRRKHHAARPAAPQPQQQPQPQPDSEYKPKY
jgi:hypothetical protein